MDVFPKSKKTNFQTQVRGFYRYNQDLWFSSIHNYNSYNSHISSYSSFPLLEITNYFLFKLWYTIVRKILKFLKANSWKFKKYLNQKSRSNFKFLDKENLDRSWLLISISQRFSRSFFSPLQFMNNKGRVCYSFILIKSENCKTSVPVFEPIDLHIPQIF